MSGIPERRWILSAVAALLVVGGCQRPDASADVRIRAQQYFETYAARDDWQAFLDFYADDMTFVDDRLGVRFETKADFAAFYNWPDPRFEKVRPEGPALIVEDLVVDARRTVARGRFTPFRWDGTLQDWPGEFTIWLTFDEAGKIVEQRDLIPYPKSLLPD